MIFLIRERLVELLRRTFSCFDSPLLVRTVSVDEKNHVLVAMVEESQLLELELKIFESVRMVLVPAQVRNRDLGDGFLLASTPGPSMRGLQNVTEWDVSFSKARDVRRNPVDAVGALTSLTGYARRFAICEDSDFIWM